MGPEIIQTSYTIRVDRSELYALIDLWKPSFANQMVSMSFQVRDICMPVRRQTEKDRQTEKGKKIGN